MIQWRPTFAAPMRAIPVLLFVAVYAAFSTRSGDVGGGRFALSNVVAQGDSVRVSGISGNWGLHFVFLTLSLKLSQSDSQVTGLGLICHATGHCEEARVSGRYRWPRIELAFKYRAGETGTYTAFTGIVGSDSLILGRLSGWSRPLNPTRPRPDTLSWSRVLALTRLARSPWDERPGGRQLDSLQWPSAN